MNSTACSPKIIIPDLYNRSSAVDSSFNNQPQVGKPTWGYDYTTVLRRLPHHIVRHHPSDCASTSSAIITHRIALSAQYTAIGEKPPKSGLIC